MGRLVLVAVLREGHCSAGKPTRAGEGAGGAGNGNNGITGVAAVPGQRARQRRREGRPPGAGAGAAPAGPAPLRDSERPQPGTRVGAPQAFGPSVAQDAEAAPPALLRSRNPELLGGFNGESGAARGVGLGCPRPSSRHPLTVRQWERRRPQRPPLRDQLYQGGEKCPGRIPLHPPAPTPLSALPLKTPSFRLLILFFPTPSIPACSPSPRPHRMRPGSLWEPRGAGRYAGGGEAPERVLEQLRKPPPIPRPQRSQRRDCRAPGVTGQDAHLAILPPSLPLPYLPPPPPPVDQAGARGPPAGPPPSA
ncbi:basic proline-rich protein-like [Choloepus didactylus]|uniref:basic proline-rich protein-like n=1 Tax=Choloepus didactylus TaxID=27675 RepID=UPI0018A1134B|nr:basic proline-rich protein-like [Choloepus didactylus]